jgi:hypothetical protein
MERANKKLIAVVGATGTAVARTLQAGNQRTSLGSTLIETNANRS